MKRKKDIWEEIKEAQKDPEFIRAALEFIRITTGATKAEMDRRWKEEKKRFDKKIIEKTKRT